MTFADTEISIASYFTDITIHYYEDPKVVEALGKKFGFNVNTDYFMALSFLYPMETVVSFEQKNRLIEILEPLIARQPLTAEDPSRQFVYQDKGVVLFFTAHRKEDLTSIAAPVSQKALKLLENALPDDFIRIGIGTAESGIPGIEHTYASCIAAVNAGEKFKRSRRILDSISMEIYSAINAMVLAYGNSLISTVLLQLDEEEQTVLGKYYKCKEVVADTAAALGISEDKVSDILQNVKQKTNLDVQDTEDNFKLHFIMIAKRVLEKEKSRR